MNAKITFAQALTGALNSGAMILNDYVLTVEETENGSKLVIRRGSEVQEITVEDGKTAYQYAVEAGYTGTEEEFSQQLAKGGASSWNDLKNKPVVYESGSVLRWDGSTAGRDVVDLTEIVGSPAMLVHVSDAVPTVNDFPEGCTITVYGEGFDLQTTQISAEECKTAFTDDGAARLGEISVFVIIPRDNYNLAGLIFPKAGVYLMTLEEDGVLLHFGRVSIPGYTGFEVEKIDPDWLPEMVNGGGNAFTTDESLTLDENNVLRVNTTFDVEQDNTLPITSAGVYATVGNIEALLKTI